jgi:hypothetical protein
MEQFLFKPLIFQTVRKCLKDHTCSMCGSQIKKGSSYFYSLNADPENYFYLKCCVNCMNNGNIIAPKGRRLQTLDNDYLNLII